jgi:hypothetical protein
MYILYESNELARTSMQISTTVHNNCRSEMKSSLFIRHVESPSIHVDMYST